jgi:hypothetical protein
VTKVADPELPVDVVADGEAEFALVAAGVAGPLEPPEIS